MIDIEKARALCDAATPGPWQWFGNTKVYDAYLATVKHGRRYVMDFARWGMSSGQPRFQVTLDGGAGGGIMRTLAELARGDENAAGRLPILGPQFEVTYRRQFVGIGHPDARFMAEARALLPAALDRIAQLERLLAQAGITEPAEPSAAQEGTNHV